MPSRMKLISRYSNGVGGCFFVFLALYALMQGDVIATLFWILVAGLAAFNLYMVEKVLAPGMGFRPGLVGSTPETVVRRHGS